MKLPYVAFAGFGAAAIAGAALATKPQTHVMNVPLPDGSIVHVEYVGDVAPKVTVDPRVGAMDGADAGAFAGMPPFAGFDRMMADLNRQTQQMVRQAQQMAKQSGIMAATVAPNLAAYGSMPQGSTSYSVTTVSNGGKSCTRTTEVVSQGVGKAPKVTTNSSGNCDGVSLPAAPPPPAPPVNRT
jgi:hypothetical protein